MSQTHRIALAFADGNTAFIQALSSEHVADAAYRQGVAVPVDCREGVCGTCKAHCVSGAYTLSDYVDDALTTEEAARGQVLLCQMRVSSDCTIVLPFDSTLCQVRPPAILPARVVAVERISESTARLELLADSPRQIDFLAGQYAHLKVPETNEWRNYSLANLPNAENRLRFLIRILPHGVMSDYLARAKVDDVFELKLPYGAFYLRKLTRPVLMIAGGTGLAPFLGMLQALAENNATASIHLLYGVTQTSDLCEIAQLDEYVKHITGFSYATIVANPTTDWRGAQGHATDLLRAEDAAGGNIDAYLCGPPAMIDAACAKLKSYGVKNDTIFAEKFIAS